MIKCNRCGNMTPAGPMCQSCGAPLSSKVDAGFSQRTGAQEQSELPAWLESLRVGERPPTPNAAPSNFSTADFIDEGPLPIWMRSERAETPDPSNGPMPEHLSAFPDQAPDGGNFPPMGLAAQSLIDEKSLPSWMKDNKQPSTPPTGFSASSLLQQDSVPDWMKTLQPPSATPPPSAATPSAYKEQAGSFEQPTKNAGPLSPGPVSGGFSAHDLIDQQALPSWMKPQGERNAPTPKPPQTEPFVRPEPQGMSMNQSGLSASSLLDVNSLPQWMREGGNDARAKAEPSQSAWSSASNWSDTHTPSTNSGWLEGQVPSSPSMRTSATPAPGANLAASSFIDANALPEWLRNASDARPQSGQADRPGGAKQGSYSVPPRVDNVRVPSRPRGTEQGSSESSEEAANVFASMLGVASTTPNYPGQPPSPQGGASSSSLPGGSNSQSLQGGSYPPMPGGPYQQLSQGSPYQQSGQLGQPAMPPNSPPSSGAFPNPVQNMGGASSYNSIDMQSKQSYGNSFSGNNPNQLGSSPSMGSSYYPGSAAPSPSSASQGADAMGDQKNAKKRGLFGAFLDWLSR